MFRNRNRNRQEPANVSTSTSPAPLCLSLTTHTLPLPSASPLITLGVVRAILGYSLTQTIFSDSLLDRPCSATCAAKDPRHYQNIHATCVDASGQRPLRSGEVTLAFGEGSGGRRAGEDIIPHAPPEHHQHAGLARIRGAPLGHRQAGQREPDSAEPGNADGRELSDARTRRLCVTLLEEDRLKELTGRACQAQRIVQHTPLDAARREEESTEESTSIWSLEPRRRGA
ncbi:hypothetical protein BLNAU_7498 [Blattamonas nauphoetae]|uniref:Uncharacterized protein n=1 Tax=Blattamonas nauphoetae TaxID=2049346 RepID=A0ABQ9Y1H6_9EUKA|nr:hypothetical protein BLNAU_7498 [Blattamonas nauphoetae]